MSKISTDGVPIPLTLVPLQALTPFIDAAHRGFVETAEKHQISSVEYLGTLVAPPDSLSASDVAIAYAGSNAAVAAGSALLFAIPGVNLVAGAVVAGQVLTGGTATLALAGKIGITIILANRMKGALKQTDFLIVHGDQTGYPALTDPKGIQPPLNPCVIDGCTSVLGMDEPLEFYGIGCYRFEKDRSAAGMGVFGTSGALAFTCDDPATNGKTMAVCWHIPEKLEFGKPSCAVTADLTASYKSLRAFYDATAGASSAEHHQASTPEWRIEASLVQRNSEHQVVSGEFVLTVSIQQGQAAA